MIVGVRCARLPAGAGATPEEQKKLVTLLIYEGDVMRNFCLYLRGKGECHAPRSTTESSAGNAPRNCHLQPDIRDRFEIVRTNDTTLA